MSTLIFIDTRLLFSVGNENVIRQIPFSSF
jgi:hypothetical protein